ncbi:MAG: hypothetical protein ACQESZ_10545 [Bacteroidota bacterium]
MEQSNTPFQNSNQEQPQNQNSNHQQHEQYRQNGENNPVSLGEWVITMIISAIPLVNLIMLFVWGFGDSTKTSKANWAKATLIFIAIGIVLWIIIAVIAGGAFLASSF